MDCGGATRLLMIFDLEVNMAIGGGSFHPGPEETGGA